METILKIDNIEKYYGNKSSLTKAIDNISFEVGKGEFVSIMGASGSGKTTLLNCISTLDKVTTGKIYVGDNEITQLKGNKLNKFRREELGFIFQDFNLLDTLTALDSRSSRMLLESFNFLNTELLATILMVTHDAFTASYCKRILFIKDGKIFNELVRGNDSRKRFFDRIIEVVTLLGGDSTNVF